MQKKSNFIELFFTFLAAFQLTDTVLLEYLLESGREGISGVISQFFLYSSTLFAIASIFFDKRKWKMVIVVIAVLYLLYKYQYSIAPASVLKEFAPDFLIHGIGGFLVGYAIKDYRRLVKTAAFFSLVYGIPLIIEPITHSFLHKQPQITGYMLTPLVIWMLLEYFTNVKRPKIYLIVGILLSLSIVLFASRGCALSILLAVFILTYYDNKKKGKEYSALIKKYLKVFITITILLSATLAYFSTHKYEGSDGSVIAKMMSGQVDDNNGRFDYWEIGMELAKEYAIKGMGMGVDRDFINPMTHTFVHNVILEVFLNFGLPIGLFIFFCYWTPIVKLLRSDADVDKKTIVACMCAMVWIRLLFSDSYLKNMIILMIVYGVAMGCLLSIRKKKKVHGLIENKQ